MIPVCRALTFALCLSPVPGAADPVEELLALQADVYVLGEVHDNPHHHDRQARMIAALGPSAVVFEMLTPDQADLVNTMGHADPEALGWDASGWPDFALYEPVFAASSGAVIHGSALDRADVRRAMTEPLAPLFTELWGGDSVDHPAPEFGLSAPLPAPQQSRREAQQLEAHCDALPEEMLPLFVQAQRLRDAAFAGAVLSALRSDGGPVVLITGNGHARADWGVPALLSRAAPELRVVTLGQFETKVPEDAPPFDVIAVSPEAARPDPCAAFN